MKMDRPPSTTGRRPTRSDSGPTMSWANANTARKRLSTAVIAASLDPNACAMTGSDGSRMLVDSVAKADNAASVSSHGRGTALTGALFGPGAVLIAAALRR